MTPTDSQTPPFEKNFTQLRKMKLSRKLQQILGEKDKISPSLSIVIGCLFTCIPHNTQTPKQGGARKRLVNNSQQINQPLQITCTQTPM